jgi:hypothetical protein
MFTPRIEPRSLMTERLHATNWAINHLHISLVFLIDLALNLFNESSKNKPIFFKYW